MTDQIRLVVADDHQLFLYGVVAALQAAEDIEVVAYTEDGREAVQLAQEHLPDLVLLDVNMPGGGLTAARDIAVALPSTKIVMLTVSEDEDDILAAMKAGASGYVVKGIPARDLITVVRSIAAGEVYISPSLAFGMLKELSRQQPGTAVDTLSTREREVLELVAAGMTNAEIGTRLNLAEKTIKHYMTNVLAKLHVNSRVEAALVAQKIGLGGKGN